MIGVTYLGNNPETQERLKYIPGRLVQFATNYKEAANMCSPHVQNEHFILFFEQSVQAEDVTAITYLKKKLKNVYIILLTHQLDQEDRKNYQQCGINDTLDANASITEINKKIQFIADREGMLFDDAPSKHRILRFKIPFWKRLFDVNSYYHTLTGFHHHGNSHPFGEQGACYLQVKTSRYQLYHL